MFSGRVDAWHPKKQILFAYLVSLTGLDEDFSVKNHDAAGQDRTERICQDGSWLFFFLIVAGVKKVKV